MAAGGSGNDPQRTVADSTGVQSRSVEVPVRSNHDPPINPGTSALTPNVSLSSQPVSLHARTPTTDGEKTQDANTNAEGMIADASQTREDAEKTCTATTSPHAKTNDDEKIQDATMEASNADGTMAHALGSNDLPVPSVERPVSNAAGNVVVSAIVRPFVQLFAAGKRAATAHTLPQIHASASGVVSSSPRGGGASVNDDEGSATATPTPVPSPEGARVATGSPASEPSSPRGGGANDDDGPLIRTPRRRHRRKARVRQRAAPAPPPRGLASEPLSPRGGGASVNDDEGPATATPTPVPSLEGARVATGSPASEPSSPRGGGASANDDDGPLTATPTNAASSPSLEGARAANGEGGATASSTTSLMPSGSGGGSGRVAPQTAVRRSRRHTAVVDRENELLLAEEVADDAGAVDEDGEDEEEDDDSADEDKGDDEGDDDAAADEDGEDEGDDDDAVDDDVEDDEERKQYATSESSSISEGDQHEEDEPSDADEEPASTGSSVAIQTRKRRREDESSSDDASTSDNSTASEESARLRKKRMQSRAKSSHVAGEETSDAASATKVVGEATSDVVAATKKRKHTPRKKSEAQLKRSKIQKTLEKKEKRKAANSASATSQAKPATAPATATAAAAAPAATVAPANPATATAPAKAGTAQAPAKPATTPATAKPATATAPPKSAQPSTGASPFNPKQFTRLRQTPMGKDYDEIERIIDAKRNRANELVDVRVVYKEKKDKNGRKVVKWIPVRSVYDINVFYDDLLTIILWKKSKCATLAEFKSSPEGQKRIADFRKSKAYGADGDKMACGYDAVGIALELIGSKKIVTQKMIDHYRAAGAKRRGVDPAVLENKGVTWTALRTFIAQVGGIDMATVDKNLSPGSGHTVQSLGKLGLADGIYLIGGWANPKIGHCFVMELSFNGQQVTIHEKDVLEDVTWVSQWLHSQSYVRRVLPAECVVTHLPLIFK